MGQSFLNSSFFAQNVFFYNCELWGTTDMRASAYRVSVSVIGMQSRRIEERVIVRVLCSTKSVCESACVGAKSVCVGKVCVLVWAKSVCASL